MLFDVLPAALFKPLAAPGAQVYAGILSDLYTESQRAPHPLSRAIVLDIIIHHTVSASADPLASADETLGYLVSCGWLRSDIQHNDSPTGYLYTASYALTPHAFRLLSLVNAESSLNGQLLAIHDLLQTALRDPDAEPRLHEAAHLTAQLQNDLKDWQHNMRNAEINFNFNLSQNIVEAAAKLEAKGYAQARLVRENFQSLDRLLAGIVARQSQTLRRAPDDALGNKLSALITYLLSADPDTFTKISAPLINLFDGGDADTVTRPAESVPNVYAGAFVVDSAIPTAPTAVQIETARRETARQINRPINRERVSRLAQTLLLDKSEVSAADVAQSGAADLSLLLQLRLYGDGLLGYRVEDGAWVEVNGLSFRDFIMRREGVSES